MASNLRAQYRATKISSLKKAVDKDDAMVGVQNNEYLNLVDGKTIKIRIFPAHPGEEQFYVPRKCYWLTFVNEEGETKRRTVLDSILHGGTQYDLVTEYVKYAKKKYGKDAEKMDALTGTGLTSNSLNPQYSWLCYADEVKEGEELHAKVWEFKKMVRDMLNKLAFSEDDDEPIEVDPFTDPDDGLVIAVKYNKNPNKKKGENYYEVDFAKKAKQPYARPLTDEELEMFSSVKPLSEVIPTYGIREYEQALEGLQNWDEENEFNLFDDDEWLEIVEKVKEQYDENSDDEKPKKKETPASKKEKKVKEQEPEPEDDEDDEDEDTAESSESQDGDEFDDMDRTELKKYNKDNELGVTVKKSMSDDDLRDAIREALKAKEEADEDDTDSDDEDEDDTDSDDEDEAPAGKVTLDDIRKKLAGKK